MCVCNIVCMCVRMRVCVHILLVTLVHKKHMVNKTSRCIHSIVCLLSPTVPSGPPQNLTLTANSSRSLLLTWTPPLPQDVNGIIVDYTINVTSSVVTNSYQVGSDSTSFTIGSLRPYVAYTCIIAAHTAIDHGPFGAAVTLTTPEDVPEAPPIFITQQNVMSRSVDLSWVAPRSDMQNGVVRYYIIEAHENNTGNTTTIQTLSAQTSFTVGDLHPYYTYTMRILAVTTGPGPFSIGHTVNTLQDGMYVCM